MDDIRITGHDSSVVEILRERAEARGVTIEDEARRILTEELDNAATEPPRTWRLKASREEILALAKKPERTFDQKALTDHMWDEGLL